MCVPGNRPKQRRRAVRAAIADIDPKLIVGNLQTMQETIETNLIAERAIAMLASVFGMLATLLAGIGLYGILAYSTAQRTREIGIRMALGARRVTVVGLILREVLILAGGAVAVTIPLAMLATRAVRSQLFGVSVADPAVYGAGILIICVVAALAGFIPARRAATVDPARALRTGLIKNDQYQYHFRRRISRGILKDEYCVIFGECSCRICRRIFVRAECCG